MPVGPVIGDMWYETPYGVIIEMVMNVVFMMTDFRYVGIHFIIENQM